MYDRAALEAALTGTVFAGKLHFSPVTGSTNTDAVEAARDGAPHGSVYFADAQSAGRGRGDHRWQSDAGQGLYVSVLLRMPLNAARVHLLPLAAGLAAAEAIYTVSGLTVDLRWPNDLLLGEQRPAASWLNRSSMEQRLPTPSSASGSTCTSTASTRPSTPLRRRWTLSQTAQSVARNCWFAC